MSLRPSRRELFTSGLAGAAALSGKPNASATEAFPDPPFELSEATLHSLNLGMKTGKWTSKRLVELYLGRIEALNAQGPMLRAVITTNPDAIMIAEKRDEERKAGQVRGPLHGIPILIKDNIATHDKMATTAGSLALEDCIASKDAFIVRRLREAGAVIIGKTNLSEWANFRSTHSSSGWSGIGGLARNPYALDRSCSGSSSGTGGGIAANLAALGIGTETDGSITSPSAACGLVGIKPTLGLVSRSGIIPIAHSQDTAGPMCRTVADAAVLLGVMAGRDPSDPETNNIKGSRGYANALIEGGLKGRRIGVCREKLTGYHPATDKLFGAALNELKRLGAVLVDPADVPNLGKYDDTEMEVLLYEIKADLAKYLAGYAPHANVRLLKDVIAFNTRHSQKSMPHFGQELFLDAQKKGPLTTEAYKKALKHNREMSREKGIDAVMNRLKLDALVAPTQSPTWTIDLVNGDHFGGSCTTPAAVAGYPHITVPMGFVHGLPVGLSFFGRAWSEAVLIKFAYAFEQATKVRKAPELLPSAPL
jgi:amidase